MRRRKESKGRVGVRAGEGGWRRELCEVTDEKLAGCTYIPKVSGQELGPLTLQRARREERRGRIAVSGKTLSWASARVLFYSFLIRSRQLLEAPFYLNEVRKSWPKSSGVVRSQNNSFRIRTR